MQKRFWLITTAICCTLLNLISMCSMCSADCGVGHAHFHCNFPFKNCDKLLLLCGPSWQKLLKIILIVQKNAPNIKEQIPAHDVHNNLSYLDQIHSRYHNTFANCVPWSDEGLCKIWCKSAYWWRSGGSLILVNGIKWGNLQIHFRSHRLSTSPCPSYFELETPFQLLKSQKTLNYWACIQLFFL